MAAPWVQPVYGWPPQYYSSGYWQYVPTPYPLYDTLALAPPGQQQGRCRTLLWLAASNDLEISLVTRGHRALRPQRVEIQLHRFLGGHPRPTTVWDVSQGILTAQRLTSLHSLEMVTPRFLAHPATEPPVSRMRIVFEPFKWEINIRIPPRAPDKFISIGLVLESIHGTLHQSLDSEEWRGIGKPERSRIYQAMCARLAKSPPSIKADGHVWKIDYLLDRTRFLGLRPTGDPETWILSLAPQVDR
jgi:Family of unknown function (DUF6699)